MEDKVRLQLHLLIFTRKIFNDSKAMFPLSLRPVCPLIFVRFMDQTSQFRKDMLFMRKFLYCVQCPYDSPYKYMPRMCHWIFYINFSFDMLPYIIYKHLFFYTSENSYFQILQLIFSTGTF